MKEIWKDIEGFPDYKVSNLGRVKSLKFGRERILKGFRSGRDSKIGKGYKKVQLYIKGGVTRKYVHRLVALAFLGSSELQVNHKDLNTLNNNILNIEYVTQRENQNHRYSKQKTSSKYAGVCFHKVKKSWVSKIQIKGKEKWLGTFKTEIEAHEAYKKALKENGIKSKYV